MRITEEEFDRELYYQTVMHFVRIMLLKGMISENEFFQIEIMNRERYKPLMGVLLSGKFLLRSSGGCIYIQKKIIFLSQYRKQKMMQ